MSNDIRYRKSDTNGNAILRLALLETWGRRCYSCLTPLDFMHAEIDHIIPHTITEAEQKRLLIEHGRPDDHGTFDLHAASNLAPICRQCNNKKSSLILTGVLAVSIALTNASRRRHSVEQYVRSFNSSNKVSRALITMSTADFSDINSKKALNETWPSVAHTLSINAPELLTQYSTMHEIQNPDEHSPPRVQVVLNEAGRRTRVILEDVYGMDFDGTLIDATTALQRGIIERLQEDIAADLRKEGHFYPDIGDPEGRLLIEVSSFSFEHPDDFTIQGTFEADMSAGVLVHSQNDSGTNLLQGDTAAHGRFSVSFRRDDDDSAHAEVDGPVIDDWQTGLAPW
ncbi:HNH endonuclease [Amycolatopsis sp. SB7-3]|uniref:HNH endonuclease n=1 Tax=Amycolatopsis sp. SB7-3 TaxID=3373438 RepID=UPI0037420BB5